MCMVKVHVRMHMCVCVCLCLCALKHEGQLYVSKLPPHTRNIVKAGVDTDM